MSTPLIGIPKTINGFKKAGIVEAIATPENISQTVLPVNGDDPFDDISD